MKLALIAADRIDFDHSGDVAQLRLDDPVLHGAQVARRELAAAGSRRAGARLYRVHEDFAKPGRDRSHRDLDTGRKLVPGLLNAFIDELTREIDIRAVLEDNRHLTEAIARQRAR